MDKGHLLLVQDNSNLYRYLTINEAIDWIRNTIHASDITEEQKFYAIENFLEGPKNPRHRIGCTFYYKVSL